MSIDAHGTRFEYLETPGTRPIVLVHGVGLDQSIWDAMLADFAGRSTLTYDLLGMATPINVWAPRLSIPS